MFKVFFVILMSHLAIGQDTGTSSSTTGGQDPFGTLPVTIRLIAFSIK